LHGFFGVFPYTGIETGAGLPTTGEPYLLSLFTEIFLQGSGNRQEIFMSMQPSDEEEYSQSHIREIMDRVRASRTKDMLALLLAEELQKYSLFDLQIIGGRLNSEIEKLPSSYRRAVMPYFRDQVFGKYHQIMAMYRDHKFRTIRGQPLRDAMIFDKFCTMVPEGCFAWDDSAERNPYFRNPKNRLFYYLIAAFTMFVLDEPGHPAGMPFPGGFTVEQRGRDYYCLIRDKEKDVFWSICNFCPAHQTEEPGT
jgi:uncharacterized protein (UPF0305 family)